ncbi:MAG: alpha/beta fold hydrolase [Pirellulaceae bacterium]|nr:alpha/beta fold hydrolase [Pirellulaceae bacterium]
MKFRAHDAAGDVSALLQLPDKPIGIATLAHGAGAGMEHANLQAISDALVRQNLATLRYQFPFMERGGGRDSQEVSFSTIRQAAATAQDLAPGIPMIAGGHSFGGRLTSMAAAAEPIPNAKGIFFCSYPLHAPGSPSDQRAIHLPQVTVPMLFVSGTRDKMMTFDLLQPTLIALGSKATFKWLETGDHSYQTLKRKRSIKIDIFDQLARAISGWFLTLK